MCRKWTNKKKQKKKKKKHKANMERNVTERHSQRSKTPNMSKKRYKAKTAKKLMTQSNK